MSVEILTSRDVHNSSSEHVEDDKDGRTLKAVFFVVKGYCRIPINIMGALCIEECNVPMDAMWFAAPTQSS